MNHTAQHDAAPPGSSRSHGRWPRRQVRAVAAFASAVALMATGIPHAQAQTPVGAALYPAGVGADFGSTVATLGVAARGGGTTIETGTEQGRGFWRTNPAAGTPWIGLNVDDDFLHNETGTPTMVVVTYLDSGTGSLTLDAAGSATRQTVALTNTNTWIQKALVVPDGAYSNQLDGDDLRLGGPQAITVAAVRVATVTATADLGPTTSTTNVAVRGGDNESGIKKGTENGRGYWQTDATSAPPATNYIYVNVSDSKITNNTLDDIVVAVDVLDSGSAMRLQYDSPGPTIPDMFKNGPLLTTGTSGAWTTATWVLNDALMTNRSNGNDFRISREGPVEPKISRIQVGRVVKSLDPKRGLKDIIATANGTIAVAEEGTRDGDYPVGSLKTLQAAVDAAQKVLDNPNSSSEDVQKAARTLYAAYQAFLKSRITTNLAVGVPATASSGADTAALVVDGEPGTFWKPAMADTTPWIQVDLGKVQPVDQVVLDWKAQPSTMRVQTSTDGSTWTTVRTSGSLDGRTVLNVPRTDARYVRVQVDKSASTVELRAFEVRFINAPASQPTLVKTKNPTESPVVADFVVAADASGKTDATAAIQKALDACYDIGGGTVWLPEGRYLITSTIKVGSFCTLAGDRKDPAAAAKDGSYGTLLVADLPTGENGPSLVRIGGSAGVKGVTTWYPKQNAAKPVPFGFTFEIPGRAWRGEENYMMTTVSDVTMLNSWKGLGVSTTRNFQGLPPRDGNVHETATVRNVAGTALRTGISAFNGADVGTWENITFSNSYWAEAGAAFNAPSRAALDQITRSAGTGLELGDLEWDQFWRISVSDYKYGVHVVPGQRIEFSGSFSELSVARTDIAFLVDPITNRWGPVITASSLEGSQAAVDNKSDSYVRLAGTKVSGELRGTVQQLAATPGTYTDPASPKSAHAKLVNAAAAPYNAARGNQYPVDQDSTAAIQRALDDASKKGGGIVYLPAGWYTVNGTLRVPDKVELRGSSAVPTRDQMGRSAGTVLRTTYGRGTDKGAFITVGKNAGVTGVQIFHPQNNPSQAKGGYVAYPTSIRLEGMGSYAVNVGLTNSWGAVDVAPSAKNAVVRKVVGAFLNTGIRVDGAQGVRIEGVLNNGNVPYRVGYNEPEWDTSDGIFPNTIDSVIRKRMTLIEAKNTKDLQVLNAFAYGSKNGLVATDAQVNVVNLGVDNLGDGGVAVTSIGKSDVTVTNLLRYNGTSVSGPAKVVGMAILYVVQHKLTVTPTPADAGSVKVVGNETQPGWYEKGAVVTLVATPAAGKRFVGWQVDGVAKGAGDLTLTITGDTTVVATFA